MRIILLLLLIGLIFQSCTAEPEVSLNTNQLMADIEYFSSDELEGRYVGSEGSALAQAYLLKRFEELGA